MFKKFALTAIVAMLLCGPVLAQTNPGYENVTATTGGVAFVLNDNPTVAQAPTRTFSMMSTDQEFTASFWKYDPFASDASAHGFVIVAYQKIVATSDTLAVKVNVIYPVTLKCDFILFTGVSATADVDLYWYQ